MDGKSRKVRSGAINKAKRYTIQENTESYKLENYMNLSKYSTLSPRESTIPHSPLDLNKRRSSARLEASTPKREKLNNIDLPNVVRKAYTPTLLDYVNKGRRGKLPLVDLTPSPKANTPASKRLVLEQFFSKKSKTCSPVDQKKMNELLGDPLGRRIASVMDANSSTPSPEIVPASQKISKPTPNLLRSSKNINTTILSSRSNNLNLKFDSPNSKSNSLNSKSNDLNSISNLKIATGVHTSEETEDILGREYEREYIERFWNDHVLKEVGTSLCITGCPGSGKTALLAHFLKCKLEGITKLSLSVKVLQINCMSLSNPTKLLSTLLEKLTGRRYRTKLLEEAAMKSLVIPPCIQISRRLPMYLITLDELDYMVNKNTRDIHHLFEWAVAPNSRLVFIGISNNLNFIDKHMALLKFMNCIPNTLNFRPYTVSEIKDIVEYRLMKKNSPSSKIQSSALELIARKAAGTGDLRKALALCRSAFRLAAQSDSSFTQLSLENALAASSTLSYQKKCALISSLTLQQKTVLTVLAKEKGSVALINLFVSYKSLYSGLTTGLSQVTRSEFSDIISLLESSSLISLSSKSRQLSSSSNLANDWLFTLVSPNFSYNDLVTT